MEKKKVPASSSKKSEKSAPSKSAAKSVPAKPVAPPVSATIVVGCAGFPVPATRYFQDLAFVEVQDQIPGIGTVRRWRKEAPPGFQFTVLAPKSIASEGFKLGKETEIAFGTLAEVAKELQTTTAVFASPPEFLPNKANKQTIRDFLKVVAKKYKRVIWDPPPSWKPKEADELGEGLSILIARDPLTVGTNDLSVAYYRLPGPAGHKSRYEDPAIERLAEIVKAAKNKEATYVFTNVDMFADAKRLKKLIGQ